MILSKFKKKIPLIFLFEGISKGISFIVFPILTYYITPYQMGIYSVLFLFFGILSVIINPGINIGFARFYAERRETSISSVLLFILLWGTIITGFLTLLAGAISSFLLNTPQYSNLIILVSLWSITESLYILLHTKIRIDEKLTLYGIVLIARTITFIIILFLYIKMKNGITGLIMGPLIGDLVAISLLLMKDRLKIEIKIEDIKNIIRYGAGLAPALLFFLLMEYADRFLLKIFTNFTYTGIYSMGYKIGGLIYYIYLIINRIWEPFIFSTGEKWENIKKESSTLILILGIPLILILLLRDTFYNFFIESSYKEGSTISSITGISYFLYGIFSITSAPLYIKNKTIKVSIIYFAGFLINIIVDFLIIPLYGITGAALSTLMAYATILILSLIIEKDGVKTLNWKLLTIFLIIFTFLFFFHL